MGLADLDMHTIYSYDGTATVPHVLKRAKKVGLDIIAITDHDEIRGALHAEELAPEFGIQVIPGIEITTAQGDLLAFAIRKIIPAGLSLIETAKRVSDQGGFCIAPHPMAASLGTKSLSAYSICQALENWEVERVLIGIQTYNATALDRESSNYARTWAERWGISQTGSSDAHMLGAIGLGATIFPGNTISDLIAALWMGTTLVHKGPEWGTVETLGKWAANYLLSAPMRLIPALAE